jgi:beta-glucosidase
LLAASLSAAPVNITTLLQQMTLEEKIGQLTQLFVFTNAPNDPSLPMPPPPKDEDIARGMYGSFLFVTDPATINRMQHIAVEKSRLHIPLLFGFDVIHGFKTIFPVPLAMAASWDPALVEQAQTVAAREASAAGIRWAFAPMVDIARDPRWGRIVEGAGEDPYLGSAIARAQVRGFQGVRIGEPGHVVTSVKHFAGYGAADGGRDYDSSSISDEQLWNVYLPPFQAAVEAGSGTVMSAYMDLNGVPATGNPFLLQDVLRRTWGFKGFVVSDAFAVMNLTTHGFAKDAADAARRAFTAGVDMDMGSMTYWQQLPALIRAGKVSQVQVDASVRAILTIKMQLGLFDHPYVDEGAVNGIHNAPEHRQLARTAAQRSAVLLRNEGGVLPLDRARYKNIAVIGPVADSKVDVQGSWALASDASRAVTILSGIRERAPGSQVEYARGGEIRRVFPSFFDAIMGIKHPPALSDSQNEAEVNAAVELASRSDVAIMVIGEVQDMSGEAASRSSLELPGKELELLKKVVATGKPVVLVLMNGRPLNIAWAASHVPAILEAWYPGEMGGDAIAGLLFGDANPGGKLPVTFPRDAGQIPIYYAHNLTHQPETEKGFTSRYWDEVTTPLYPFGYGLSYTTFEIANLRVSAPRIPVGGQVQVTATVRNSGSRAGDEVVQLYIHQQYGSASRPVRELKGFERVSLAPGETRTVRFTLGRRELGYWSSAAKKPVLEASTFDVWVGSDSNAKLHTTFQTIQ